MAARSCFSALNMDIHIAMINWC